MLHLRRRHLKGQDKNGKALCAHTDSSYLKCKCPLWAVGTLDGKLIRKSLDTTSLERAEILRRDLELKKIAVKPPKEVMVKQAAERWIADCEARMKPPSVRKYREVKRELLDHFRGAVRSITVDDISKLHEGWQDAYAPSTRTKRLELVRAFFSFCISREWIEKNPAKFVKAAAIRITPTAPFSEIEWQNILTALDVYGQIHVQSPVRIQKQLKALVLLLRYSGLRISDCVGLKPERISGGRLLVQTQKTGKMVHLPLPEFVLEALSDSADGDPYYFWNGVSTLKSRMTEWQERLKKVAAIAGVMGRGFAHRCRASFSVELLNKGVPLEMVAQILGNSPRIVEKHYASFVQSRQVSLEAAVKATW